MKNRLRLICSVLIAALVLCTSALYAQSVRVAGSPYPYSAQPDTLYLFSPVGINDSAQLTIETLQGVLAKTKPAICQLRRDECALWLKDLVKRGVVIDSVYLHDYKGLIRNFNKSIKGYILCHPHDSTANAAISLCGIKNAIAVSVADTALMRTLHIPMLYDVRHKGTAWVYANFSNAFSEHIISYQKESKDLFLADYSVFAGALQLYNPINGHITKSALARMQPQSALFGWGSDDEHILVKAASENAIYVHAADWATNLSVLSNFNIAPIKQNVHSRDTQVIPHTHTVCFVMTDGDNVQWLLNSFMGSPHWYGSPNRGKVNIGWTVSPAMAELAPTVLDYFYQHAANNTQAKDYFIAGPSGLGYFYPDKYKVNCADSSCALLNRYMAKANLNIVNIIGDKDAAVYLIPYVRQPNIDAVFYYDYYDYAKLKGKITFINNKPIIGGRYYLWNAKGFETVATLPAKLNALPKDPYSEAGYSLIPVNVWSNNVDSVIKCVRMLDSTVRVVTPDVFVKLIARNVLRPKQVDKIEIHYVDFTIKTEISVGCNDFENFGNIEKKVNVESSRIEECVQHIRLLKQDAKAAMPDTRARIIITYNDKSEDIICMGLNGICYNGKPLANDTSFTDYIMKLTKQGK